MLQTILASLLINGVVVGTVAGVLCLLLPRFGRLLASRRAVIWLVMAALLFIPFGLPARSAPVRVTLPESPVTFSVPVAPRQSPAEPGGQTVQPTANPDSPAPTGNPAPADTPAPVDPEPAASPAWDIDLFTALGVLWLGGAAGLLCAEALRFLRWRRRVLRWTMPLPREMACSVRRIQRELGCRGKLALYTTPLVYCPMVTGLFRPKLLLPESLALPESSPGAFEILIRHEISHIQHRDIAKKLLLLVARCLHWFNPLIWLLERRADKDIELACDERVLRGKTRDYRLAYGALLVESAKGAHKTPCPALSTAFDSGKKSLMERLRNMVRGETRYKGTLAAALLTLALLLALSLVVVIPVSTRADTPGGENPNPAAGQGDTSSGSLQNDGSSTSGDPAREMPHTPLTGNAPEPATLPFEPDNPPEAVGVGEPPVPPTHALAGDAGFLSAVRLAYPDEGGSRYLEIYRSFDGGATWEQTPVDTSQHFSEAFVIHHGYTSRENGYIVVGGFKYSSLNMGSYVYRTTDGGENWEVVRFVIGEPDDILFINHETLLISARAGGFPRMMMTEDGGKSWREQDLTPLMLDALDIDGEKFEGYFTHLSASAEDGLRLSYRIGNTGPAVTVYSKDGAEWSVESIV